MAQLKDSVVQGSLRVTDTIFSNQLTVNDMLTANKISTTGGIVSYTTNGDTAFNALGIIFSKTDNTVVGRIGMSTSQTLGIYAGGTIFIRPNSASAASTADGVKVDGNGLAPTVTNTEDLGTSSLKWKNVYATTFNGALSGNATTTSRANLTTTTNAIAYYSGTNGAFANGSYVKYLAHTKVTTGTSTTEKFIDGLHISGTAYNAAADVISGVDGKLSYGDAGAQIRFTDSDQSGAILFHRWDSGGNSVSFNFLSNQSTANVGALVRAGAFAAVERAAIGQLTTDTNYVLKVNGVTQINGSIYLKHNTINIQDTGNKNGITSDTGYYIWARDKNDIDYGILQMFAKTDGQVSLYIGVRNYSGTTNRGWKGLQMYANKSGGASVTSTCGTWTYQNGYLNIKNTTVNLKNESNGVSSNTVMYLYSKDTNDYVFGTFETAALTNGNVYAYMGVNNRNTSGTAQGWSGIKITQTKANVITYTITDPTAFKTALSLDNVENTAISTWTGTTNVGTLKGLTLSGTAADSYVAAFAGTTDASSSSAAAVTIAGGLAVAKSLYVGTPSATQTFPSQGIHVWDARTADISPSALSYGANFYFINKSQPHANWSAGIYVRGWHGNNYAAWCLVGPADNADYSTAPLYVRTSKNATTWGSYRKIYDTSNKPSNSDVGLGNVSNNSNLNGSAGTKGDMIYWSDKDTPARLGIGTANHILIATANGPVWSRNAHIIDESGSSVANKRDELVLGNNTASSSNGSSFGRLALYSENTAGTYLVSASGTAWKTATLQAKDGTIAYTADITSAIQALDGNLNSTTPGAGKTLTAFSQTDGKVSATFGNISITASQAGLGNVSNNANLNGTTGTKGDMIYWSAANTPARLAIGTTGQNLWATANGPAWKKAKDINKLVWTNTIQYDADNDEFIKNSDATADWNAQVYSSNGYYHGCYVSFIAKDTSHHIMVGLNSDPTANANWTGIDYCWYLTNASSNCNIRESNSAEISKASYAAGDEFRIEYYNKRIKYYHNGNLIRTVPRPIGGKLYLDSSIHSASGAIKNLEFGPISGLDYITADEIYFGANGTNPNLILYNSTDATLGLPAFKYNNYHFGTNSFGIPDTAITIETTTNGTAASPTWTTATNAWYTASRKRNLFNHNETQIPVGNLGAFDYWNNTAGTAFTYNNNGTNETHYAAPITAGMGVRITANFESCARRFYMSIIETYWRAYIHNCTGTIEGYCTNTGAWTTIGTFTLNNTDTRRFYRLGGNKYIGGTASNASYFNRLRWTLIVNTVNSTTSTNKRYAPSIAAINIYGPGMPGNVNNTEYRFAYEMARHGQPIYVTNFEGIGAAHVPTGSLTIGDNLLNTAANTEKWANLIIGNNANVNANNTHSQGRIYLYSAATAAHVIVGSSTTTEYTHTLPNNTGMIVSLSGSTAKGSGTKPVYVPATGIVTECSTYAGGTAVTLNNASKASNTAAFYAPEAGGTAGYVLIGAGTTTAPAWYGGLTLAGTAKANWIATFAGETASTSTTTGAVQIKGGLGVALNIHATKVYNAVWNDYAECRKSWIEEPGRVITEDKSGVMELATQRLMPACKIISDTYGTLMGETETSKTPIAVAGRVLAYPYKDRAQYQLGDAVCSAPNGTVDIMSRDEIMMFPERIIGTVSEIPSYEIWHAGTKDNPTDIEVNGRIWIYVR